MATSDTILRAVREAVQARNSEAGERNAIAATLIRYGYAKQPHIYSGRTADGRGIRVYVWSAALEPGREGDLLLVTGPNIEGEVHRAGDVGFEAKGGQAVFTELQDWGEGKAAKAAAAGMTRAADRSARAVETGAAAPRTQRERVGKPASAPTRDQQESEAQRQAKISRQHHDQIVADTEAYIQKGAARAEAALDQATSTAQLHKIANHIAMDVDVPRKWAKTAFDAGLLSEHDFSRAKHNIEAVTHRIFGPIRERLRTWAPAPDPGAAEAEAMTREFYALMADVSPAISRLQHRLEPGLDIPQHLHRMEAISGSDQIARYSRKMEEMRQSTRELRQEYEKILRVRKGQEESRTGAIEWFSTHTANFSRASGEDWMSVGPRSVADETRRVHSILSQADGKLAELAAHIPPDEAQRFYRYLQDEGHRLLQVLEAAAPRVVSSPKDAGRPTYGAKPYAGGAGLFAKPAPSAAAQKEVLERAFKVAQSYLMGEGANVSFSPNHKPVLPGQGSASPNPSLWFKASLPEDGVLSYGVLEVEGKWVGGILPYAFTISSEQSGVFGPVGVYTNSEDFSPMIEVVGQAWEAGTRKIREQLTARRPIPAAPPPPSDAEMMAQFKDIAKEILAGLRG